MFAPFFGGANELRTSFFFGQKTENQKPKLLRMRDVVFRLLLIYESFPLALEN